MNIGKLILIAAAWISMWSMGFFCFFLPAGWGTAEAAEFKVLHVMSYHSPWRWTDGQFRGFKDALKGLDIEYRVFQMDTKRNSSVELKEQKGREARDLIDSWKPDLVYTSDDDVQQYVTRFYIDKDIPFIFSGVNKEPKDYGFEGSRNVSGVLEEEHFVESVRLLKEIEPKVRKIAVVLDQDPMWKPVMKRMRERAVLLPEVEFVTWDIIGSYREYKKKMQDYQGRVDAVALIGIFTFQDEDGRNVPYQEVLKWTAENSELPDFSYWVDRVHFGTLCAVNVSEYEQGLAAGKIARAVLADGRSPSEFPMATTVKGVPLISLPRANRLGISVRSGILLSAEVIREYEWAKP